VERVANAVQGATKGPPEVLRGLSAQLVILREGSPQASDAELGEAAKNAMQKLVVSARQAKARQRQLGLLGMPTSFDIPQGALCLPEPRGTARQDIPGAPSGRMLGGAILEVEQLCNYMCCVGTKLHKAIGSRNVDSIKSHRRALKSGVAQMQETAARGSRRQGLGP
jgi:hypothetical protein